jgi:hypothetical protein
MIAGIIINIITIIVAADPNDRAAKAWPCGRLFAGITASNPAGGMDVCLLWVLCVFW